MYIIKNYISVMVTCISSHSAICNCLRMSALIGRINALCFLSGKMLVSRSRNPILAFTLTDHRHFLGWVADMCLISLEIFSDSVTKCREAGCLPLFRSRMVVVKEYCIDIWSINIFLIEKNISFAMFAYFLLMLLW